MKKIQLILRYSLSSLLLLVITSLSLNATATTFAVIGDFGDVTDANDQVSKMVDSWNPEFIITLGDNDYEDDYRVSVLPYYGDYISSNCSANNFFPTYGNHDWKGTNGYDDVFPCIDDYYKFTRGDIEFFTINSDALTDTQTSWLQTSLQSSNAKWKVVFFHHSPYSSGRHGSNAPMQLDYAGWGADIVMAGHDHVYERISRDGIYYIVNGLGGRSPYDFDNCCVTGSQVTYNDNNGAMRIDTNGDEMRIRFIAQDNRTVDDFSLTKDNTTPTPDPDELVNGRSVSISGSKSQELEYFFELPEGARNLNVAMSGGSGDGDLYVNYNTKPSSSDYDCRPYLGGNNESCSSLTEQAGTWYVSVKGYSDFSDVNLVVNWDYPR